MGKSLISPVFRTFIDIAKNDVVKLAHKGYVESVEQKNPLVN